MPPPLTREATASSLGDRFIVFIIPHIKACMKFVQIAVLETDAVYGYCEVAKTVRWSNLLKLHLKNY